MHVCTCAHQEVLGIEDRLDGVTTLYCENFSECGPSTASRPAVPWTPPASPDEVFREAVEDVVERHHTAVLSAPALPSRTTLAPRRRRSWVLPTVGIAAAALLLGAALTLSLPVPSPGGGGGPPTTSAGLAPIATAATPARRPPAVSPSVSPMRPRLRWASPPAVSAPKRSLCRAAVSSKATCSSASASLGATARPEADGTRKRRSSKRLRSDTTASTSSNAPEPKVATVAPEPVAPKAAPMVSPPPVSSVPPRSLAGLLRNAAGKQGTVLPPPERLPQRLSAAQIVALQRALLKGGGHCLRKFGFTHVTARVSVRLRGVSGRPSWSGVRGRLRGTPVGRCLERTAMHLRAPRFLQSRQTVTLPIRVH